MQAKENSLNPGLLLRAYSSERGVIVRTGADAIPQQSRAATGVRLQRLDKGDLLSEVVLVPPEAESEEEDSAAEGHDDASDSSDAEAPSDQDS